MVAPGGPTARRRSRRLRGGLVTVATVSALAAAMGLTVLGLGAADNAVAGYDASSWLWSAAKSELARVNGVTGRVDTRMQVPDGRGHQMQVVQTDRLLILRDLNTGTISSLDLATLQVMATTKSTAGIGVNIALHENSAFVVDAVQGIVRQLDPRSLTPVGEQINYPPGITGGAFDGTGKLWVAVPSQGTVSAITPAELSENANANAVQGGGGSAGGISPKQIRSEAVAEPSHDLKVSTLDDGIAVLDRTTNTLTTLAGEAAPQPVTLPLTGPGQLPTRTTGEQIPVTVIDDRNVVVSVNAAVGQRFTVPGEGTQLDPAVAWAGRFYCADQGTGKVYSFDEAGKLLETIEVPGANGPLELEVRENHLFVNAPNSDRAKVIDDHHLVQDVNKYANDILGGDPPPTPPPPPPPKDPVVSKPGAPRAVTASAGNAQARVSWRPAAANGAAITRYVVEGAGKTFQVGADQRSLEVTGLTNGETYRFSVHAVNAKGAGPARRSNPVTPTSEVPDPPANVTAEARPDGTVVVKWPEANGQGYKINKYAVTAISAGANAPAGEATGTELVIPAGELTYGSQYAFTVVSINEKGAGSAASPVSGTVVPFTTPEAPVNLNATTVTDAKGAIRLTWATPADNGRPITKYLVDANGQKSEVPGSATGTTVNGFGNGAPVTARVQAVNEAGPGAAATKTAQTLGMPNITVTGGGTTTTSITVEFTMAANSGTPQCSVTAAGRPRVNAPNCKSAQITGLTADTAYSVTVTATNAAGTFTTPAVNRRTAIAYGIATCKNGQNGDTATYCDRDRDGRNGNEIFSGTQQDNDKQVGWAKPGTRLRAYCKKSGEEVYAYIYNNDKRSTWWVQVNYEGRNYIPWAWLNLEGGDNINVLPTC
ncbi:fibronectin type III domain-containing protein [Plantactinospora sp. B24E8]|uniref:fibronectin type III domain-containing protein n=1 Tax=Plantactinospora sp. B24E8 TaxID=3153567 RepID=UPI00325D2684